MFIMKIILISFFIVLFSFKSSALSLIRDSETESVIRQISNPILQAADLTAKNVQILIINDNQINAFVAGGQNIFINTGLLRQSNSPEMLIGVIAHEAGHIAGGHILRSADQIKGATIKSALGYILGIAAIAAGSPELGQAIAMGSSHIASRQFLKHTRSHEESADQAALSYLDKLGYSSKGLKDLLNILYSKQLQFAGQINPYAITHPLTSSRISHVENHLKNSPFAKQQVSDDIKKKYARVVAKLDGFLDNPDDILQKYPDDKNIFANSYARAIAYHRKSDLKKSLEYLSFLSKNNPDDGFLHELRGQILFENGKIAEAVNEYQKATNLIKQDALIKVQLAVAQIASEDNKLIEDSIINLRYSLTIEPENIFAWRQLAIAYGRNGQIGLSNIALAEEALLKKNKKDVNKFIKIAKKHIKKDTPAYYRAEDILQFSKKIKDK